MHMENTVTSDFKMNKLKHVHQSQLEQQQQQQQQQQQLHSDTGQLSLNNSSTESSERSSSYKGFISRLIPTCVSCGLANNSDALNEDVYMRYNRSINSTDDNHRILRDIMNCMSDTSMSQSLMDRLDEEYDDDDESDDDYGGYTSEIISDIPSDISPILSASLKKKKKMVQFEHPHISSFKQITRYTPEEVDKLFFKEDEISDESDDRNFAVEISSDSESSIASSCDSSRVSTSSLPSHPYRQQVAQTPPSPSVKTRDENNSFKNNIVGYSETGTMSSPCPSSPALSIPSTPDSMKFCFVSDIKDVPSVRSSNSMSPKCVSTMLPDEDDVFASNSVISTSTI